MAKTILVTESIRVARDWCNDNGRNIREVEVITRPEDTHGIKVDPKDQILYVARIANRHTNRAYEMLQSYQRMASNPTPS